MPIKKCLIINLVSFILEMISFNSVFAKQFDPLYKMDKENLIFPESASKATLYSYSNGLKLIVIPEFKSSFTTMHFMIDAGSNRETKNLAGLSHFFEHMVFRKSKNTPEGNFDKIIKAVGGKSNAFTYNGFVTYFFDFPASALDIMLKSSSHMIQNVELKEPYFSIEKGAILSERRQKIDNNPDNKFEEKLNEFSEKDFISLFGTEETINNFKISDAENFFDNYYTPSNTLIIIGGPFKPEFIAEKISRNFSSWKKKDDIPHAIVSFDSFIKEKSKLIKCVDSSITSDYFEMIYPSNQISLKDYTYFEILSHILYNDSKESYIDELYNSYYSNYFSFSKNIHYQKNNIGSYYLKFYMDKNKIENDIVNLFDKYIKNISKEKITEREKRKLIDSYIKSNALSSEKISNLVEYVKLNQFFYNDFSIYFEKLKLIENLNYNDFSKWIDETFINNKRYYKLAKKSENESFNCKILDWKN